jgi:serine/threonine protein kinase
MKIFCISAVACALVLTGCKKKMPLEDSINPEMVSNVNKFNEELDAWDARARAHPSLRAFKSVNCEPNAGILIGLDSKGFFPLGKALKKGGFGQAYDLPTARAVLKVSIGGGETFYREKIGLSILNGLNGSVPRVFDITCGVEKRCSPVTIAMEKIGDTDWADLVKKIDKSFYLRFAKLLQVVKDLHQQGFVHKVIHGSNVRVKKNDPNFAGLIDFGLMQPFIDDKGLYRDDHSRALDAQGFLLILNNIPDPDLVNKPWFHEFSEDMNNVQKPEDQIPFDKWIAYFENEAKQSE